jgi:5-dehydro-2-deoxygluconokinase
LADAVIVGRISVDLYPEQTGPLEEVSSFAKSVGGTAANVAVAAARLGVDADLVTGVGDDPFGSYLRGALQDFGVGTQFVHVDPVLRTPLAFAELDPPESPGLLFYRAPSAPDLQLELAEDDARVAAFVNARVGWVTGTGLSVSPSVGATLALLEARAVKLRAAAGAGPRACGTTVIDLDWRPMLWPDPSQAQERLTRALAHATVGVGNREEISIATGVSIDGEPEQLADAVLAAGPSVAIVKCGEDGTYAKWRRSWADEPAGEIFVLPTPVPVICGLGAGDAFGGALVEGIVSGRVIGDTIRRASLAGAIVASRLACADAMPTEQELESA